MGALPGTAGDWFSSQSKYHNDRSGRKQSPIPRQMLLENICCEPANCSLEWRFAALSTCRVKVKLKRVLRGSCGSVGASHSD